MDFFHDRRRRSWPDLPLIAIGHARLAPCGFSPLKKPEVERYFSLMAYFGRKVFKRFKGVAIPRIPDEEADWATDILVRSCCRRAP